MQIAKIEEVKLIVEIKLETPEEVLAVKEAMDHALATKTPLSPEVGMILQQVVDGLK